MKTKFGIKRYFVFVFTEQADLRQIPFVLIQFSYELSVRVWLFRAVNNVSYN